MKKLLSTVSIIALSTQGVMAQQPTPANLGISYVSPNILSVLDSTNTWAVMGTINPSTHVFTPVSGGGGGGGGVLAPGSTVIAPSIVKSFLVDLGGVLGESLNGPLNIVNVLAYSADGSGALDSTIAINNALSASGVCTYFPQGTYYVTNQLNGPSGNGCIFGDNAYNTTIIAYNSQSGKTNFNIGQPVQATASFLTGALTIPVNSCPGGLSAGGNVYDTKNWTIVAPLTSCIGTTLTLQSASQTDSVTSGDTLQLGGALGVLVLQPNSGGNGDTVRDIGFDFKQPQVSCRTTGVNGCAQGIQPFPPAIKLYDHGRDRIQNVRVADANICLDARTSGSTENPPDYTKSGGGGVFLDDFECGALTYGWLWDGAKDTVHWNNAHFWPFGNQLGGSNNLNTVYSDGANVCFQNGRVDGLAADGVACFKGNANFTANAGSNASGTVPDQVFTNLHMDNYSAINVAGGVIKMTGGHHTYPATATTPAITVSGGSTTLRMNHYRLAYGTQASPRIVVTNGGQLFIKDSSIVCSAVNIECGNVGSVGSGILDINGVTFGSSGTYTTSPLFEQIAGSLGFSSNIFTSTGPNLAVKFDVDNANNFLGNNRSNGWTYTLPSTTSLGIYSDSGVTYSDSWQLSGDGASDAHIDVNNPSKSTYFRLLNNGVREWELGNLGASNTFILQDIVASTSFMSVVTGGAATIGEGALLSFNGQFADVGTHPTYTGTCPVQNFNGGSLAGRFQANGNCSGGTVIATFPASAAHGFTCDTHDLTTPTNLMNQTAYSINSATFTGNMTTNDIFTFKCIGF